jgi:hypothetical protein
MKIFSPASVGLFFENNSKFQLKTLALMVATSFFESLLGEQKRYSEQRENAPKKNIL